MAGPIAYLNGRFVPQADFVLPFHDAGFVLGATVTDLCRTFHHRLFRLQDHLERFRRSCELAEIPQLLSDEELAAVADELVGANAAHLEPKQELILVMIATPGAIGYLMGQPGGAGDAPPTLALHTFPLPFSRYRKLFDEGVRLVVPKTPHVPSACIDPRIKQRSRLHWWLADRQVHKSEPGASALLLDGDGHVTETATANFLLVRDATVYTPPRASVLGGISLQVTQELCRELGIRFEERPLRPEEDCLHADEAMLSSTPYCLAGVKSINRIALPWPGPVFERLMAAWDQRVGLDIRSQFAAGC
jgi:branched-subunit amino acid aminotransferase/4-amino-4-deoxychorismate lyase